MRTNSHFISSIVIHTNGENPNKKCVLIVIFISSIVIHTNGENPNKKCVLQ